MKNSPQTQKQIDVYNFLVRELSGGLPPTVREICRATGIKSTSTVHAVLESLEEQGLITRDPHNSRAIRITAASDSSFVPVVGRITAGQPILAVEEIEDYIPYPTKDSKSLFALRVVGLSMRDAGILDGDIIIADRDLQSRSGDIVVALDGEEATVKRLLLKDGQVILMPENPDYSPIYPENPEILGKVVGNFRKY
ncbi:MAG: transcriptional repressor LexA [Clostridia bacterium]|nr:transcriptional repressor LexA [Clostridia bacterium]MBQ2274059.1 transcriptional repressor LexA [Clostridia bacterium]MBQ5798672.1 transcriptional repressor LexA [Clostridia bacterium]MBQ5900940.1 transcriptional repressor LexA [Clostridia bacterium]